MRYLFLIVTGCCFFTGIHAQVGTSPLEANPDLYYKGVALEKKMQHAKLVYPIGSGHYYIFDTLSLPFVDDFSRYYFKSYEPWDNSTPVDSVAYNYRTEPFLPHHPFRYRTEATYHYTIIDTTTVDSVENFNCNLILFNDSVAPFTPYDTIHIWEVTTKRYYFDQLNGSIDSTLIVAIGTLTADTLDTIKVYFPDPLTDQSKWIDNYVYPNRSMGVNPPTYGVATFDGTNELGKPYRPGQASSYGVADYLTSKPIDLDFDPADSVYISFFYQAQGRGYAPSGGDSLVLEFYDPAKATWHRKWAKAGGMRDTFRQVLVGIADTNFLRRGFQFRFKNYGNLSGNLDHWSIDYVKLDTGRSKVDTVLEDVAFVEPPTTILRRYQRMPYTQFKQDNVDNKWENKIANHSLAAKTICYRYDFMDGSGTVINSYPADYTPLASDTNVIQPLFSNGYPTFSRWAEPDFNFNFLNAGLIPFTDSADYTLMHYIENFSLDTNHENDTIFIPHPFHNYFAYDDGTAEEAIWLGSPGAMAVQFNNNYPDTLRAIQFYFSPIREDIESRFIDINVYSSLDPEDTLLSFNRQIRVQEQETDATIELYNNGFTTYLLDEPLALPAGDFYIGWSQEQNFRLNLGFDRNTDASEYIFFNTTNTWDTLQLRGSVMIRPLVGPAITKEMIGLEEEDLPTGLTLYPNPSNDVVYFRGTNAAKVESVEIIDMTGKQVRQFNQPYDLKFSVEGLTEGLYLARFQYRDGIHSGVYKIVVKH